jgi:hypothetical protein
MNHELLLCSYYPEAIRGRPRRDLRWLAEHASTQGSARLPGELAMLVSPEWSTLEVRPMGSVDARGRGRVAR